MLSVLPIKLLHDVDLPLFGSNIFNLSQLEKAGFPVLPGIAVVPPEFVLQTVIKHLEGKGRESFEQSIVFIEKELISSIPPEVFLEETKKHHKFLYNYQFYNRSSDVWQALVKVWLEQVRSFIWRHGFVQGLNNHLTTQLVYFCSDKFFQVEAFYNDQTSQIYINAEKPLSVDLVTKIQQLVDQGNKKLYIPQIYKLIVIGKNYYLLSIHPYTHQIMGSTKQEVTLPALETKQIIKSASKVFVNLSSGFVNSDSLDGVLLEGEVLGDFESTVFKLSDAAIQFGNKPVLYKLPNIKTSEVSGSLYLLHNKTLLKHSVEAVLFARHKKSLVNVEVVIPSVHNGFELSEMKKELGALGLHRKGMLRFWLELSAPENFINVKDYIEIGIDGVVIDLDALHLLIGGYSAHEGQYYKNEISALIKFLEAPLKELHKDKLLVLVKGKTLFESELLEFLLENGVWGVVSNTIIEAESLPEHLSGMEKRIVSRRLS